MLYRIAVALGSLVFAIFSADAADAPTPKAEMKAVLDELEALGPKPIENLSPAQARMQPTPADAVMALLKKQGKSTEPERVGKMEDRKIKGPGGEIPIRIYWPAGGKGQSLPVVHYIHGGGWVIADLDVYDASPRAIANAANAIVVSSHYRQAPEHPFPAAHEDSFAAYRWVLANAKSLGGDPRRVAVAGESAGGNMAAAIGLMAREKKVQMPVHQVLVYPVANYGFDTPSYKQNEKAKPLGKEGMEWFFGHYLESEKDGKNPRVSILGARDLSGMPPATIITAEIDPLRSEGEQLAGKLKKAGV
ncbi:MAG TPA: alpha/beta hydrolase, partial [Burkholderiales bacterium]|nr:alpha/beta hydrolase [Burkholderiales bacterium]